MERFSNINQCYRAYTDLFGTSQPIWSRDELQSYIKARMRRYEDVDSEFLDECFDESMSDYKASIRR